MGGWGVINNTAHVWDNGWVNTAVRVRVGSWIKGWWISTVPL